MRSRFKRNLFIVITGIISIVLLEMICATALRIRQGEWIYKKPPNYNFMLFEPHPSLVGVPRKSVSVDVKGILYKHNKQGFRDDDFQVRQLAKRIACIGGSTTYCVSVNNDETWSNYLDSLLADFEVLNCGIPGHSTEEHKKLLPDVIKSYKPELVIIQAGLNDLRCMNVSNLSGDYSNFHQPTLFGSFGFCPQNRMPHSGLLTAGWIALRKMKLINCCSYHSAEFSGTVSDKTDEKVMEIFSRNIDTLIGQCISGNIRVVLVPQILLPELISDKNYQWWVPYLTKEGIIKALSAMNDVIRAKANGTNILYVDTGKDWQPQHFADISHLSKTGNVKLATLIKEGLQCLHPEEELDLLVGRKSCHF